MQVTSNYIASVLETLPIGYYFGKGITLELSDTASTSHANPITNSIVVASRNIFLALGDGNIDGTPEEVEEYVRDILYHELSHLILTGDWSKVCSVSPQLNIFEDERIETLLAKYYHGTNFKRFVFKMNDWTPTKKPENELQYFFHIVRFRRGPADLVEKVTQLILKWKDLNAVGNDSYVWRDQRRSYRNDVDRFYAECCARFAAEKAAEAQNEQANGGEGDPTEGDAPENGNKQAGDSQSDTKGEDDAGESSGAPKEQNDSGEGDSGTDDGTEGEDDSTEGDGQQAEGQAPNLEGDGTPAPESGDSGETENENGAEPNAQGASDEGDSSESDAENSAASDGGSEADCQRNSAADDAENEAVKALGRSVDSLPDREDITKIVSDIFKETVNTKQISDIQQRMKRLITKANNRRAFQSPYKNGFAGKINPRLVAFNRDYRWLTQKNPDGSHHEGSKIHITFWVDNSGSFRSSEKQLNSLMAAMYDFERDNGTEFSYDVVTMNDQNVEHDKSKAIRCESGNRFGPDIKKLASRFNRPINQNYNVVVWDGDLASDNKHWSESWEDYAKKHADAFGVFDNKHTVIIADDDNEKVINIGCPNAKKTFIRCDYANRFIEETLKLLEQIMGC